LENGWIKLHRKITKWEWYGDPFTSRIFFHLLVCANHADGKWRGTVVKRGQIITGYKSLSKTLGISVRSVRTSFKRLISTGEVTIETTNKFSVVTLVNYEVHNPSKVKGDTQSDTQDDNQTTIKRQSSDTKQEEEELKKKKKTNIFEVPTRKEVREYIAQKNYKVDADYFYDKYENENPPWSNNKGKPMTSWKSTLSTWNQNVKKDEPRRGLVF
jgi:hypothetical protein